MLNTFLCLDVQLYQHIDEVNSLNEMFINFRNFRYGNPAIQWAKLIELIHLKLLTMTEWQNNVFTSRTQFLSPLLVILYDSFG